jgi:hypothetical protein
VQVMASISDAITRDPCSTDIVSSRAHAVDNSGEASRAVIRGGVGRRRTILFSARVRLRESGCASPAARYTGCSRRRAQSDVFSIYSGVLFYARHRPFTTNRTRGKGVRRPVQTCRWVDWLQVKLGGKGEIGCVRSVCVTRGCPSVPVLTPYYYDARESLSAKA